MSDFECMKVVIRQCYSWSLKILILGLILSKDKNGKTLAIFTGSLSKLSSCCNCKHIHLESSTAEHHTPKLQATIFLDWSDKI